MYQRALEGVRVVDFSWVVAGPYCTKLLALMGADVIKIESSTRPQYKQRGAWFSVLNNSKKSCTVNLATDRGKALIRRLISVSDVTVENFSTGVMERLGLGYEAVRSIKPDIIYISSSGVGRTGPGRNWLAYGTLLQGLSGWTSLFNEPNPRMEGMGVVPSWTDPLTGLWEAFFVQSALWHRARTGKGIYVDLSMLESTIVMMGDVFLRSAVMQQTPGAREALLGPCAAPQGIYPCKEEDAWLAISVHDQVEWSGLGKALDGPAWCNAEAFQTSPERQRHRDRLDRLLGEETASRPVKELFHRLQAEGVPAAPCYNLREIVDDPHMQARGLFRRVALRDGRSQLTTCLPWREGSDWKGEVAPPPGLGEHNDYVFRQLLGMSAEEYESYQRDGTLE